MSERISVLQIEDDPHDAELIAAELRRAGMDIDTRRVASHAELARALADQPWDIILCDYQMPGFGAMPAFVQVRETGLQTPFIVVTGTLTEETAVECLKSGIDNYILKENLTRLVPAVRQAIQMSEERRRSRMLEEEVRQAQKMEAVGRLAGGVAHDFNNLLTVIFANTARLRRTASQATEITGDLDAIEEAARQAKNVTNSLLALCRKSSTRRVAVDVGLLVRDAARLLRRVLPASITLDIDAPPEGQIWANADATQMHQVLMNLAINARDAMPKGGTIRFTVRPAADPDSIAISVDDTGAGMTSEVAARALEPFFTTKPRGQGTGLGLSVVHGIVSEHQGSISIFSRPGQGTRVTITLPASPAPACFGPPSGPAPRAPAGIAVVMEENALIRGLLVTALQSMGLTPEEAADAKTAIDLVKSGRGVGLLVLDADAPRSGPAAAREVRQAAGDVPTVVITGNARLPAAQDPEPALLLRKPFQIDEFRAAVTGALRGRTA